MKKIIISVFSLFLSISASAHVCHNISNIEGFSYSKLFSNAIINEKSIDYYIFSSECKKKCLYKSFKNKNLQHSTVNNNISVFDNNSVATLTIDNTNNNIISGYLTCSSNIKRYYISIPFYINRKKITLDLQTEEKNSTSRTINVQNYTRKDYLSLVRDLEKIANTKNREIGFMVYSFRYNHKLHNIKISNLTRNGDFMLIIEKLK